MRIRLLSPCKGWKIGSILDLDEPEAVRLVAEGVARLCLPGVMETATADPKAETAVIPAPEKQKRKV